MNIVRAMNPPASMKSRGLAHKLAKMAKMARGRNASPKVKVKVRVPRAPTDPGAAPSPPHERAPLLRSSSQIRFHLRQRATANEVSAKLEALDELDRRSQNGALFGSIGRRHPNLLAPLHYFACAQANMGCLRGVQVGMQMRNQDLLWRTAMNSRIVGLDAWLVHLCAEKLGAQGQVSDANVDDINRMFLELQEALNLCPELTAGEQVNVGCDDATYTHDPQQRRARSFDLDVRDARGQVTRQIEVTSCGRPVQRPRDLRKALEHFNHKLCDALPNAKHEGAIALAWDPCRPANPSLGECLPQPFDLSLFLQAMVAKLENQSATRPHFDAEYASAGCRLDRLTLFSNDPTNPLIFAILTRSASGWQAAIAPTLPAVNTLSQAA